MTLSPAILRGVLQHGQPLDGYGALEARLPARPQLKPLAQKRV